MDQPQRRIAVVGADGFLGSAIGRSLSLAGYEVVAYDLDRPFVETTGLDDGARDAAAIVWAAASVNPVLASEHPDWVIADRQTFVRALEAAREGAPQARVILLSSGGTVYGPPSEPPFDEDEPVHPVNAYGESKAELERVLWKNVPNGASLRIANAYGPGQKPAPGQGVIAHWLQAAAEGRPLRVYGSLNTSRDYIYVDDIGRAVTAVVESSACPPALNVGSGSPATLSELLDITLEVTGSSRESVILEPARSTDAPKTWLSIEAARKHLGWEPTIDLRSGIRKAWEALKKS